ncbi:MAG: transketolase [Chlamydiae bacterium RIFCSPHIGHO2_12_FULL_44_59]|nr:MAG: transketolase [Chlamydiae bacterium RIFCSPHIGHO2_01_FULL_44_39]OGN58323.1 MAG: transketolase [Chlamydiae bacterium RIFCSPHIGHO2_02_FULL_45_9]OGN60352.1 MAG: transketolase [Chlamydiae bacterium RIFCSPHIGHO2_12_FULL_44_59]OGN66335.1 MAG: transketolase [Chlamydiae bacterium RIFCSPLOWO2_01_FULL_44_52]OGN69286.1 MAG: transketolase [Chlamydiae bacterium RIFCSPLOWO2_02_FULL_45_22]OGN70226.1 MAG: transketolase [Chlamydiae bacterium RIFCSPLOWO2_12_FULL_45_20]
MNDDLKKELNKIANTIRQLSIEAVQKANSGHPGLPMGCAEFGAYLYGCLLRHNPKHPKWLNRDRLVLSAGHGSMWLYACLHLAGFPLSMEDIKQFRQLHSMTPGHPEYGLTEGIEATTGPLGQGVANAVGMALGMKILAEKFNRDKYPIFNNKVYCLAGDGCMMEGISAEASSFAGHLAINNMVLIYDANHVCLDGPLNECMSEDTKLRYKAYGWDVFDLDGYDLDRMEQIFSSLREKQERPALVMMNTIIGKGSPNKAGLHTAHGSPLGSEELALTKEALGLPKEEFYVPQAVRTFFEQKLPKQAELEAEWHALFRRYSHAYPDLAIEFKKMHERHIPEDLEETLKNIKMKSPLASRASSGACIQVLAEKLPQLYGGSADLSGSDSTMIKDQPIVTTGDFNGRNLKYGVREFAMAAMNAGLFLTDMIQPFCGTFLTFSDYMRNAIRLACLSPYHVIYQFTHDSIFLGEDGPTHQPVEHYAALRAMPHLHVIRPCDSHEVRMAWLAALQYNGPTALILSRQNLPDLPETLVPYKDGVGRGAYIIKKEAHRPDYTLFATGSEVALAMEAAKALETLGKQVRVVSMPCWEIFESQEKGYKDSVVEGDLGVRVSIEAGTDFGWQKYTGRHGINICIEGFGHSAPAADLAQEFGFTPDAIVERLLNAPRSSS